jgi:hypothetical protein
MAATGNGAAVRYLRASGASAVQVLDVGGELKLHVGTRLDPAAVAILWAPGSYAAHIGRGARSLVRGERPTVERMVEAIGQAASAIRTTATPHAVALERAAAAARRLDDAMAELNGTGRLAAFNREFANRRRAAVASGSGFMSYGDAMGRLRKALVPVLAQGGDPQAAAPTLFASILPVGLNGPLCRRTSALQK